MYDGIDSDDLIVDPMVVTVVNTIVSSFTGCNPSYIVDSLMLSVDSVLPSVDSVLPSVDSEILVDDSIVGVFDSTVVPVVNGLMLPLVDDVVMSIDCADPVVIYIVVSDSVLLLLISV